ncbi:MAG TPA: VWA domain-containing protein [Thermoanaerobaculia bacterium]|nr:VWA domain-containing protein [Thermoanaerobaculia bacterium]
MIARDLVAHVARFGRALRERGVRVSLSDEIDAVDALVRVDLSDRAEVRCALAISLKIRRRDAEAFDELFDLWWAAPDDGEARERSHPKPPGLPVKNFGGTARDVRADVVEREVPTGETPGYSREAALRRKPFEELSPAELAAMEDILSRLSLRLATSRSRRLVPTRGRGRIDLRRSFRAAVSTDGEFLRLARRTRAIEEPRLVVLCDTSGSMDPHTRFVLAFLLSLKKAARRTELFAFNTSLVRLTPWITAAKLKPTLEKLAAGVPGWSGGTRIGESLEEFVERYGDEMVGPRTVVVIVSDGLDRGDTDALVRAMRRIRSRARRIVWLNPLLADPRYEPTARGMAAARPFIHVLAPAHNLESLERLLPLVAA